MAGLADQFEQNIDAYLAGGTWNAIETGTNAYVALCTGDPGNTRNTPANEVTVGGGYTRKVITQASWDAAANGAITNNAVVSWTASIDWGAAVTHWMLCDYSAVDGTFGLSDALQSSVTVLNSDTVKFKAGDLDVEIVSNGLFTYAGGNLFLDKLIRDSGTGKFTMYVALSTTTPSSDGTNFTEPGSGAYARVISNAFPDNATGSGPASLSTDTAITWPEATASWGTLTHWGIYDASTSGNLMVFGALDSSQAIGSGDQIKFGIGDLTVTLE